MDGAKLSGAKNSLLESVMAEAAQGGTYAERALTGRKAVGKMNSRKQKESVEVLKKNIEESAQRMEEELKKLEAEKKAEKEALEKATKEAALKEKSSTTDSTDSTDSTTDGSLGDSVKISEAAIQNAKKIPVVASSPSPDSTDTNEGSVDEYV